MKDNREFLEGIYKKAEVLERERNRKNTSYQKYIRFSSVAAAILIMIPLLLIKGQNSIPKDYTEIPQIMRMVSIENPMVNFYDAEYIVSGEVKKIEKSQYIEEGNYIYTDTIISLDQIFLGDIPGDEIVLRVKGGIVKKEKIFSQIEGEFKRGQRALLFLVEEDGNYHLVNGENSQFLEVEKDVFIDKLGNKYTIDNIKENIDRRQIK